MPQSLSQVIIHLVFSTKNRERWIEESIQPALFAYLAVVCRDHDCQAHRVGGTADHIHVGTSLARTVSQSDLVEKLKVASSKWMKMQARKYAGFSWQRGYGCFSISPAHLPALVRYIDAQKEHHQKESFQDEFRRLLTKYCVAFDEKYLWD